MTTHVLTIKDPDRIGDFIDDVVGTARPDGLTDDEWDDIRERRGGPIREKFRKWIEYGEYLRIEFDLDAGTAIVKPVK